MDWLSGGCERSDGPSCIRNGRTRKSISASLLFTFIFVNRLSFCAAARFPGRSRCACSSSCGDIFGTVACRRREGGRDGAVRQRPLCRWRSCPTSAARWLAWREAVGRVDRVGVHLPETLGAHVDPAIVVRCGSGSGAVPRYRWVTDSTCSFRVGRLAQHDALCSRWRRSDRGKTPWDSSRS